MFELADFHLSLNGWERAYGKMAQKDAAERKREAKKLIIRRQLERIIGLMFAHPFITPTFDEYAMFMAYSAGLRSADLSRQIGAVIATPSLEIVAMGANDCPRFGGGQYWPVYDGESFTYGDEPEGRDYTRGYDSNRREHRRIVDEIVDVFKFNDDEEGRADRQKAWDRIYQSRIKFLTEYGRPVHAEMAAILFLRQDRHIAAERHALLQHLPLPQLREAHNRFGHKARRIYRALSEEQVHGALSGRHSPRGLFRGRRGAKARAL